MKKLMMAALVAATGAFIASAESGYWTAVNTTAYSGDASPSTGNASKYEAYWCTVEAAEQMFGSDTSVAGISSYLSENYTAGKEAMASSGNRYGTGYYGVGQYTFQQASASSFSGGDYLAVIFYGSTMTEAFRVFGSSSARFTGGNLVFDDAIAASGSVGGWTTTPEPTSGLLLLIGCATLALRRGKKSKA